MLRLSCGTAVCRLISQVREHCWASLVMATAEGLSVADGEAGDWAQSFAGWSRQGEDGWLGSA
jgi:hypothetical protein